MSDHLYEMRRADGGLGQPRLWCAMAECRGVGQVVADPGVQGGVFPHAWLVRKLADHLVEFGDVEQLDAEPPRGYTGCGVPGHVWSCTGTVHPSPELRADLKASWDVKLPEQRNSSGWLVLLGGALAVAGGILGRFLGWS